MNSNRKALLLIAALSTIVSLLASLAVPLVVSRAHRDRMGAVIDNLGGIKFNASGIDFNSHKGLNVTNGSSAQDVATFGQVPLAATATPAALGTAAVGSGTRWAKDDHVHSLPTAAQVGSLQGIVARLASTAAFPAYTYANGTSGVGATITFNSNAACTSVDGIAPAVNDVILFQHGAAWADNGVYSTTQLGDGSTAPCIYTRDARADTAAEIEASTVYVSTGVSRRGKTYQYINRPSPTIGTHALAWGCTSSNCGPNEATSRCDDFEIASIPATATILNSTFGWLVNMSSASLISWSGANNQNDRGIVTLNTGTTNQNSSLAVAGASGDDPPLVIGTDVFLRIRERIKVSAVSDGTNTYRIQAGFGSASNGLGSTDGVFVEHDISQDATHWLMNTRASSTTLAQVAGTISAGTFARFDFVKFAGEANPIHTYQDGAEFGTGLTTSIPSVRIKPLLTIVGSAGAVGKTLSVDYFCYDSFWPKGRG